MPTLAGRTLRLGWLNTERENRWASEAVVAFAGEILGDLSDMTTPTPKLPWYQFSLRSLLLFTLFVALLCSIRVSTG